MLQIMQIIYYMIKVSGKVMLKKKTYWCPPLKPCQDPPPCSASQKHLDPGRCGGHEPMFRSNLHTVQINTAELLKYCCSCIVLTDDQPACLHQRLDTQKEANVLFIPQVLQHFLPKK